MKKTIGLLSLTLSLLTVSAQAVDSASTPVNHASTAEKDAIMKLDQVDGTDALAIPLDESEVEDDLQIDMDEHRPLELDLPSESNAK